ncbi:hypothetical protein B0H15DRAFT_873197, partial [Mycena belliarum]
IAPYLWFRAPVLWLPTAGKVFPRRRSLRYPHTPAKDIEFCSSGKFEAAHAHTLVTASSPPASVTGTTCNFPHVYQQRQVFCIIFGSPATGLVYT